MVKTARPLWLSHCIALSLILLLIIGLAQAACVQDTWIEVPPLHPGDMTSAELEVWQVELGRINDAMEEIDDEHEYKRKEYECDGFSDYSAGELAKRCFRVKRAMSYTFQYPDGRTGPHHWLFVIVEVGDREVWAPVECTPPNGERQKQYECDCCDAPDDGCPGVRIGQFPRMADEAYHGLVTGEVRLGQKFDERYFGNIIVWDVATMPECSDSSSPGRESGGRETCPADRLVVLAC